MKIDDMPAGREMDALIAEKIFGKVKCQAKCHNPGVRAWLDGRYCYALPGSPQDGAELLLYSHDISAAWEVVEKMGMIMDLFYRPDVIPKWAGNKWYCKFECHDRQGYSSAETLPLAICRAALKTIEEK